MLNNSLDNSIKSLLVSDFCAAAVLISFGAVLGKASLSQLIIMATFEVVIQSVNEHIGLHYLHVYITYFNIFNALTELGTIGKRLMMLVSRCTFTYSAPISVWPWQRYSKARRRSRARKRARTTTRTCSP